ncbi:MAG: chromate transporter [Bacillota bacterium]
MLAQLFLSFFRIGLFCFGGGYAMIPLIEREIIIARGWLTAGEFLDIAAVAEITPGPVAVNVATFVGYRLAGIPGAATATAAVILPAVTLMVLLCWIIPRIRPGVATRELVILRPAMVAMIGAAALFVGRAALVDMPSILIYGGVLSGLFSRRLPLVPALALAGVLGMVFFSGG